MAGIYRAKSTEVNMAVCIKGNEAAKVLFEKLGKDIPVGSVSSKVEVKESGISVFLNDGYSYRSFFIENDGDMQIDRSGLGLNGNFTEKGVFTPDAVAKAKEFLKANLCSEKPDESSAPKVGIYRERVDLPKSQELYYKTTVCYLLGQNWLTSAFGCFGRK